MSETIRVKGNYAQLVEPTAAFKKLADDLLSYRRAGYQYTKAYQGCPGPVACKGACHCPGGNSCHGAASCKYSKDCSFVFKYRWDGRTKLLSERLIFPSGLVDFLEKAVAKKGFEISVINETPEYPPLKYDESVLSKINLHRVGKDAVTYHYQAEAVETILREECGIIHIATNGGKTQIAIAAAKMFHAQTGKNVLFLTHRSNLFLQTCRRFELEFDDVGFIGNGEWNPRPGVTVALVQSLSAKSSKDLAVALFSVFLKDGMLFADECHHASSDEWYKICMRSQARCFIGLSGTPLSRSDGADMRLIGVCGEVICKIRNADLIAWGFSVEPVVFYTRVYSPRMGKGNYKLAHQMAIVKNAKRNAEIAHWCEVFVRDGLQVLVLYWEIEHGAILYRAIRDRVPAPTELLCGSLTAQQKKKYLDVPFKFSVVQREAAIGRFQEGETNVLVSSSILDEGMDISNIDALILAAGQKSTIRTLQRIGRSIRKSKSGLDVVFVVDFADFTQKRLQEHSLRRYRDCKREGFRQCEVTPEEFVLRDWTKTEQKELFGG